MQWVVLNIIAPLVQCPKQLTPWELVTHLSAILLMNVTTTTRHVRQMVFASLLHALMQMLLQPAHQRIASMIHAKNVQQTMQHKRLVVDLDTGAMTRILVYVKP